MYNNNDISQRIKATAKEKGITIKELLGKCDLNINYLSEYAKGQDMSTKNFFKICNYLGISADYLLGRSDSTTNQINNNGTNNGTQANVIHGSSQLDSTSIQVAEMFQDMNISDKTKVLNYILNVNKKENEDK